jgi:hypothetical protein
MIQSRKFRHKKTGEIATQIPILDMKNWEPIGSGEVGAAERKARRWQRP